MSVLPTKVYNVQLEREMKWAREQWDWTDDFPQTPENIERIGRDRLECMKIYEYPTRGLRDELRQCIAFWLAPWLAK